MRRRKHRIIRRQKKKAKKKRKRQERSRSVSVLEVKTVHFHTNTITTFSFPSPRFVPAPHHRGWFSLPSLVEHRVHKLKDMCRTKLEGGARTQHRCLCNSLPVDKGVGVWAVRRHGHHTFTVHEVAVVGQNPWTYQLEEKKQRDVTNYTHTHITAATSRDPL